MAALRPRDGGTTPGSSVTRLTGGIPAYNEGARISVAIRSLLGQRLPEGVVWDRLIVVASGCTDRTAERAKETDPRVEVVVQQERRGKASALLEIFQRARGDFLVLLNADAIAGPEAIARSLAAAGSSTPPFVVMARPVPENGPQTPTAEAVALLWEAQHRFQQQVPPHTVSPNLSDELVVLPICALPPLPEGVVNDGGYIASWLRSVGGASIYVPEVTVSIEIPRRFGDHVSQRRRILWGTEQLRRMTGRSPGTVLELGRSDPLAAVRLLRDTARGHRKASRSLALLGLGELLARLWVRWDFLRGRHDHIRWATIPG